MESIEDPDINAHTCGQLIFNKDTGNTHWKTDSICNKLCWSNQIAAYRRIQIDPYLPPCTKLNSRRIKDLHIRPNTLYMIVEKVESSLELIGTGDDFLNRTPIAQALR